MWLFSDCKTPPPKIYQGCNAKRCESGADIPISDRDELLSSCESSNGTQKRDSLVITNGTHSSPRDGRDTSEDENAGGEAAKSTVHSVSQFYSRRKHEEPSLERARSTGTILQPPDNMGSYVNSDAYSNKTCQMLIKNRMNLCDMPLESSPRQGLFAQRRLSQASYGLFPIDDIEPVNGDRCYSSSFSPINEVIAADGAYNSPGMVGSSMVRANSYKASSYDIASSLPFIRRQSSSNVVEINASSFGHRQSLSNVIEMNAASFGRKLSLSNLMESHVGSPSTLIPVYSAKSIQRVASSLTTGDSFYIPPGQNFIIDLSWEQFGQLKNEDGWCTSVRDLPPIPDEDVHQMGKPDFFISDDEGDDDEDTRSKPEVKEKSSEVDVEKLLKSTDEIYKSFADGK